MDWFNKSWCSPWTSLYPGKPQHKRVPTNYTLPYVIQKDFSRNNINRQVMRWQQDGVPAHKSDVALQYLRGQFPGRVMFKRGDWPWPPRSPDLAVSDFFLWGYLKQQIWEVPHNQQPQTLRALPTAVVQACNNYSSR